MKLLHIDSSILGAASASRQLSAAIVDELARSVADVQIIRRDLESDPSPHLDSRLFAAAQPVSNADAATRAEAEKAAAILEEFLDADVVAPVLTTVERDVISASLRDPVWSLGPSGRVRRALHWTFDVRRPNPLADARLEALRRYAVLVRHFGDRLDSGETARLALAGYSAGQIRAASWQVASAAGSGSRDA